MREGPGRDPLGLSIRTASHPQPSTTLQTTNSNNNKGNAKVALLDIKPLIFPQKCVSKAAMPSGAFQENFKRSLFYGTSPYLDGRRMMSLVFEEEMHQLIQVILNFNSEGLRGKQNACSNIASGSPDGWMGSLG